METVGILGCGALGTALAHGWQRENMRVLATRKSQDRSGHSITWCRDNAELLAQSSVIVLATKPKDAIDVLASLRGHVRDEHVFASVAAGVDLGQLRTALGARATLIRAMPNVAARAGRAMTALSFEADATERCKTQCHTLFARLGRVREVDESALDLYTALAGSGPAFVSIAIEGFADGAVRAGLHRNAALEVATQAFLGAAQLMADGMLASELRDMIATPAGCTVEGLAVLESGAVRATYASAIWATVEKLKSRFRS